uniref:Transposase n=1 Tax=Panagrolaimus davidi TaxID=227884 RepID=A0A914Q5Y4_9BILA
MSDLKEHDAICHRHYEEFSLCDKGSTNIKKHLIVPENVLPNHIKNIRNNVCREIPNTTVLPSKLPDNEAAKPHPSSSTLSESYDNDFDEMDVDITVENVIEEEKEEEQNSIPNFLIAEGINLMALFQRCCDCGTLISAKKNVSTCGTALIIKFYCSGCKEYKKWTSQSTIGDSKRYTDNVLIPSTAVLTPISHSSLLQFSETLGMPMVKWTTFSYVQRNTFTVVAQEYGKMMEDILGDVLKRQQEGEEVFVSADAQFDSRGYCAKQGWETIMCSRTKRVLTGHLLENTETNGNSSAMEVEGLRRGLLELGDRGIGV